MRIALLGLLLAPAMGADAAVPTEAVGDPRTAVLQTVTVKGSPGPGMWRVSSGGHTLWILGTLSPLPAGMEWKSGKVQATIARSQAVLGVALPRAKYGMGTMFKMATLMPSVMRTQRNPGDATLESVLGQPLYARWAVARDRYFRSKKDLETLRPLVASERLYWQAIEVQGLDRSDVVGPVVRDAAKRAGLSITDTGFSFPLELDRKDLKRRIDEMNSRSAGDLPCFEKTLDVLEPDLSTMRLRADAWAVGDVGALRRLSTSEFKPPCQKLEEEALAFLGIAELRRRLRESWLVAAQDSLANNQDTFATLPISDLLDKNGLVEELRRRGYAVEAPDDVPPEEMADEPAGEPASP